MDKLLSHLEGDAVKLPPVVNLIGAVAAGKTTAARILEDEFGYEYHLNYGQLRAAVKQGRKVIYDSSLRKPVGREFQDLSVTIWIARDEKESHLANRCAELADFKVLNDGTIEDLKTALLALEPFKE